ncbi:hypothetical protein LINPERHAP2_LOCUS38668 [Linum perenne]
MTRESLKVGTFHICCFFSRVSACHLNIVLYANFVLWVSCSLSWPILSVVFGLFV